MRKLSTSILLTLSLFIFSSNQSSAQTIFGARSYGGEKKDKGRDIGVDASLNMYLSGFFTDSVDFGNNVTVKVNGNANDEDIFIMKADPDGEPIWARSLGNGIDNHSDFPFSYSANAAGYSAMTGNFKNYIEFDDGTILNGIAEEDLVLVLFNTNGDVIWAKVGGGLGIDRGTGVFMSDDNFVYCTGNTNGDFDLFGDSTFNDGNEHHIYVAKYDLGGNLIWLHVFSSHTNLESRDITGDNDLSIYVGGNYAGTVDFEDSTFTALGDNDGWIVKYDTGGDFKWAKTFGSSAPTSWECAYTMACDTFKNLYVATVFEQDISFDGNITTTGLIQNIGVAAFNGDAGGTYKWAQTVRANDGVGQFSIFCLGLYGGDNVILTGCFAGEAKFGLNDQIVLTPYGPDPVYSDAFLAGLTLSDGSPSWAVHMGGPESDAGFGLAGTHNGFGIADGDFRDTASFGVTTLISKGSADIYVLNFKDVPDGIGNVIVVNPIALFPNPTYGKIAFTVPLHVESMKLTNAIGQTLMEQSVQPGNLSLDLEQYMPGIYILQLNGGNDTYSAKLILQK